MTPARARERDRSNSREEERWPLEVFKQVAKCAHETTYVNQLKKSYKQNIKSVRPSEKGGARSKKDQTCVCELDSK